MGKWWERRPEAVGLDVAAAFFFFFFFAEGRLGYGTGHQGTPTWPGCGLWKRFSSTF